MTNYQIITEWSAEDACYIARVPEFPGLATHGATEDEATREAHIALEAMLDVLGVKTHETP